MPALDCWRKDFGWWTSFNADGHCSFQIEPPRRNGPPTGVSTMWTLMSTRLRYGTPAQFFHWLTVVLVATAYLISPGGSEQRVYSSAFDFTRHMHETTGILIFAILLARILWRTIDAAPEAPPMEPWMTYSARLVHLALYALLIALPSTAIFGAWLEGHPLTLLGVGNLGPMLTQAHDVGQAVSYVHTILGNVIIWATGLHAIAALFHHFVLRDNVLTSMLPDWRRFLASTDNASQRPA
jgi:cytochrome b561